jgi:uncharacterized protein (DUF58 family)
MSLTQQQLADPKTLSQMARLQMRAQRVVEGVISGLHRSPYHGFSVEFAQHREYTPGDEIRYVDWKVFGRSDRYYIKEFEEETNLKAYLLVDASGSMAFRGSNRAQSKFEYAQHVAASLAYLMLQQMDAVGLITLDTKLRSLIPARANPKHLLRVLTTLEKTQPGGETAMAPLWHELAGHHMKRRGMIIILSDFFDRLDDLVRALQHLRHRNHEVVLLHVLAPEELEFPYKRLTQFRSLEGTDHKVLVDARRLRDDYLHNFEKFRRELKDRAAKLRVDYHLMRTDAPVDRALGIYLSRRQRA